MLLLVLLKSEKNEEECSEMVDSPVKVLHEINNDERIVLVRKSRQRTRFLKLNLDQINKLCKSHNLISHDLSLQVDRVRDLRNRQHLGGLQEIEVTYTKADLEFVFSIAKSVTRLVEDRVSLATRS